MRNRTRFPAVVITLMAAVLLWEGTTAARAQAVTGLMPADPQPGIEALKPGLGVKSLISKFNSLWEIEEVATWSKPQPGEPLPMLNYNVGTDAVLSNHNVDLVGAFIGEQIYEDGIVAPDRFSPNLEVQIETPGWYPIALLYYEKKNTSTLELYWQPPGAEEFVFVPAEAFAHLPEEETS